MKPEQIYEQLTDLAEKLRIKVAEKNLRQAGFRVRSGLCRVQGESIYVMDKNAAVSKKIKLLAECLSQYSLDSLYVVPAVREVIERHRPAPVLSTDAGAGEDTRAAPGEVPPENGASN
jgi:hypothetical protein